MKLVVGITNEASVTLIKGQLKYFKALGYETYLLAPAHERTVHLCKQEGAILLPVAFAREMSFFRDIVCLFRTILYFIKIKPDIVNVGTPKAGLIGTIASRICRVPKIFYTCRGYRYEQEDGLKRKYLILFEKLSAFCSHKIICISESVRDLGVEDKIFALTKAVVINKGSSNGIDLVSFSKENINSSHKDQLRKDLNLQDSFVYGFVGRVVDRKGINEIFKAFENLYKKYNNIRLIVVGRIEGIQINDKTLITRMSNHEGVIVTGPQFNVPLYMSLMDVFVMPSWSEGFGNVLVQAASMGLPVISANATGCKDAVSDGYNGILINRKDVVNLQSVMEKLLLDQSLRNELGGNGIIWSKNFTHKIIWEGLDNLYNQ